MLRGEAPIRVAVLCSILIAIVQIAMHIAGQSGLIGGDPVGAETAAGILFNLPDALSYASWAYQAKLGFVTFSDLFTTEEHAGIFFNLYFLVIGSLARAMRMEPLILMELSSFLLGPALIVAVLRITRQLKFDATAQALAIGLVLFGSGLSGLLVSMEGLGIGQVFRSAWLAGLLRPGADATYHDLFPLTELVFYPYHSTVLVLLALTVFAAAGLFEAQDKAGSAGRAVLLGLALLVVGLVRPYEAVTLTLVFNLTALVWLRSEPRWPWTKVLAVCCIVDTLAVPPIVYAAYVATLPIWGNFADRSMDFVVDGIGYILKGFGVLWALAGFGLIVAFKDRRRELCFVGIWAIVAAAVLCLSPSHAKFAGGSVLADALLAAYGFGRLLQESSTPARRWATRLLICTIAVMTLTPIVVFVDIAKARALTIDTSLIAVGKRIRELEGERIPIVLTDLSAGAVIPGLFGERVYAGHWTLTPDLRQKGRLLTRAGIEPTSSGETMYDRDLLSNLIRDTKANYLLLRRTAPAAEAIARCGRAEQSLQVERWIAVNMATWSCP